MRSEGKRKEEVELQTAPLWDGGRKIDRGDDGVRRDFSPCSPDVKLVCVSSAKGGRGTWNEERIGGLDV